MCGDDGKAAPWMFSVLLQGYPNLEYIIIDGGSSDRTMEIVKKYEPWLTCWTSESDAGQSDAISKGFSKSNGRILSWLNSDDFLEENALGRVAAAFAAADEHVGAVVGMGCWINEFARPINTIFQWKYRGILCCGWPWTPR